MLVVNGDKIEVPGLEGACYLDRPELGFTDKSDYGYRRTSWVRSICIHTRMGIWPQSIAESTKDRHWDELGVRRASDDERTASWHVSIDSDGSYVCHLDLAQHKAYHAGQTNEVSIGIEMYQRSDGTVTQETLDSCVKIVDVLTREFGIQRQFVRETVICRRLARGTEGTRRSQKLAYMPDGLEGKNFVGVFGHRNATKNRGRGDPGDKIFEMLEQAGYEGFYVDQDEDISAWAMRQKRMGLTEDGVPGPATHRKIEDDNQAHGIWIPRPGDDEVVLGE